MLQISARVTVISLLAIALLVVTCSDKPVAPTKSKFQITGLSMARGDWHVAARPIGVDSQDVRFKTLWHMVYGDTTPTMQLVFRPEVPSMLPASPKVPPPPNLGYASLYSCPGITLKSSFKYLNLTVRGRPPVFRFEYGWFNQDVDGNLLANSEDQDNNGYCEPSEDVGLDGIPDNLEPGYDPVTNRDPNGDDYYSGSYLESCPLSGDSCGNSTIIARFSNPNDPLFYERLNGTEGNLGDLASLGRPDKEQLSQPLFNFFNSYYSFLIDLTSDSMLYSGPDSAGWRTYHIPLLDPGVAEFVSDTPAPIIPDPMDIRMIRIWGRFLGTQTTPDTLEIRDLYLYSEDE
ncbi:MAG: hypothetical protein WAU88_13095 [Candidatus Zixiibacteriota bacterium]